MKSNTKLLTCILAIAIAAAFMVTVIPVTADAENDTLDGVEKEWGCGADGSDVKAKLNTALKTMLISGNGQMLNYTADAQPEWVKDDLSKNIEVVIVTEGVENIGDYAFANLENLQCVELDPSVTVIGKSAFENSGLLSICIQRTVVSVGENAFNGCMMVGFTVVNGAIGFSDMAFGDDAKIFIAGKEVPRNEYDEKLPGNTFSFDAMSMKPVYQQTTKHIVTVATIGEGMIRDASNELHPRYVFMIGDDSEFSISLDGKVLTIHDSTHPYPFVEHKYTPDAPQDSKLEFKDWETQRDTKITQDTIFLAHFEKIDSPSDSGFPVWAIVIIVVVVIAIIAVAVYFMTRKN